MHRHVLIIICENLLQYLTHSRTRNISPSENYICFAARSHIKSQIINIRAFYTYVYINEYAACGPPNKNAHATSENTNPAHNKLILLLLHLYIWLCVPENKIKWATLKRSLNCMLIEQINRFRKLFPSLLAGL